MLSLRHSDVSVHIDNHDTYGGGQQHSRNAMVQRCGCGIIAATDTLLYLSRYHMGFMPLPFRSLEKEKVFPFSLYDACILNMRRRFFPMIPYAGINGLMMMRGMERFFRKYHMPFSARWCFTRSGMWEKIEQMLQNDIPVIMSVGPNFPLLWGKEKTSFYVPTPNGLRAATGAKAHYFTVTGMDENWLRISSWGRLFYLNRAEFETYVNHHSAGFISNILYIEKK